MPRVTGVRQLFTAPPSSPVAFHAGGDRWLVARPTASLTPLRLVVVQNFFEELRERVRN